MPGDSLMQNALAARGGRLDGVLLDQLLTIAAQDGEVDADERRLLEDLPWPPRCRATLTSFLQDADAGVVRNPEVDAMRRRDPHFEARVAAIVDYAKPGDLILWGSDQPGPPWNVMRATYGRWMHVSVVLEDGRLLDPYWPEGLTISTPAAAVAKSFARVRASQFMVTRLPHPLQPEQLARLSDAVRNGLGKPYSFVAPLERPCAAASCSRVAWDLFRELGVDLAPPGDRLYRSAISPCDMMQEPVAFVGVDAVVSLQPAKPPRPQNSWIKVVRVMDKAFDASPRFRDFMFHGQGAVTWMFMTGMARMGSEVRPGFAPEDPPLRRRVISQLG